MHKYKIIIYWSDEDQVFVSEVPELPGCMAHGDTQTAALKHANEAIQLWIDTATEFGDAIPEAKGKRSVSSSTKLSSKRQNQVERLHLKRKNNPRSPLNTGKPRVRMTPKAH